MQFPVQYGTSHLHPLQPMYSQAGVACMNSVPHIPANNRCVCSVITHIFTFGMMPLNHPPTNRSPIIPTEKERKQRAEHHSGSGACPAEGTAVATEHAKHQHSQPPWPAYDPTIIFRYPTNVPAPVSDREVTDLCFPHQVRLGQWSVHVCRATCTS